MVARRRAQRPSLRRPVAPAARATNARRSWPRSAISADFQARLKIPVRLGMRERVTMQLMVWIWGGVSELRALPRLVLALAMMLAGCNIGPSEERLNCLNGCAREKDQCMLSAMTPGGIRACDDRARRCTEPCPQ